MDHIQYSSSVESTSDMSTLNGDRKSIDGRARGEGDDARKSSSYPRKLSRESTAIRVESTIPYKREKVMKWHGWGYNDSQFYLKGGRIKFSGSRYPVCNRELPYFKEYIKNKFDVDLEDDMVLEEPTLPRRDEYPPSKITESQADALRSLGVKISTEGSDRLVRSHGQSLSEMCDLAGNAIRRIPDLVAWPTCHEDVVEIVRVCDERDVVVVPFGGGTSVSAAARCPAGEARPVLSLDTSAMNEILAVDRANSSVRCEAGIVGQDLERELRKIGYTCGHEPDSIEFSTLGGWVATRASGMKKNAYGNIEDIVVHARMVTPRGVLEKGCRAPRVSCGPDFDHVILGSEGCLGVVTEATVRVRELPSRRRYGSFAFPDLESGVECMRSVARRRCQPASLRLMDNEQFQLGRSFREEPSYCALARDALAHFYIAKIKGFDVSKMTVMTALYEGSEEDVDADERKIKRIASEFGGLPAGEANGERGYDMTFIVAYIRDVAQKVNIMCESLETSVPWDRVLDLIEAVKVRIAKECARLNVKKHISLCRVAQVYDTGACVYFYFAFNGQNVPDPIRATEHLEESARDEMISMGGSISHHHGVGKLRKKWYEKSVSPIGNRLFDACKSQLDPNNIFAIDNLSLNSSYKS